MCPYYGIAPIYWVATFAFLERSDEFQLCQFIVQFKGLIAFSTGLCGILTGAARVALASDALLGCLAAGAPGGLAGCALPLGWPGGWPSFGWEMLCWALELATVWTAFLLLPCSSGKAVALHKLVVGRRGAPRGMGQARRGGALAGTAAAAAATAAAAAAAGDGRCRPGATTTTSTTADDSHRPALALPLHAAPYVPLPHEEAEAEAERASSSMRSVSGRWSSSSSVAAVVDDRRSLKPAPSSVASSLALGDDTNREDDGDELDDTDPHGPSPTRLWERWDVHAAAAARHAQLAATPSPERRSVLRTSVVENKLRARRATFAPTAEVTMLDGPHAGRISTVETLGAPFAVSSERSMSSERTSHERSNHELACSERSSRLVDEGGLLNGGSRGSIAAHLPAAAAAGAGETSPCRRGASSSVADDPSSSALLCRHRTESVVAPYTPPTRGALGAAWGTHDGDGGALAGPGDAPMNGDAPPHQHAARFSTAAAAAAAIGSPRPAGPRVPLHWAVAGADAADRRREATAKRAMPAHEAMPPPRRHAHGRCDGGQWLPWWCGDCGARPLPHNKRRGGLLRRWFAYELGISTLCAAVALFGWLRLLLRVAPERDGEDPDGASLADISARAALGIATANLSAAPRDPFLLINASSVLAPMTLGPNATALDRLAAGYANMGPLEDMQMRATLYWCRVLYGLLSLCARRARRPRPAPLQHSHARARDRRKQHRTPLTKGPPHAIPARTHHTHLDDSDLRFAVVLAGACLQAVCHLHAASPLRGPHALSADGLQCTGRVRAHAHGARACEEAPRGAAQACAGHRQPAEHALLRRRAARTGGRAHGIARRVVRGLWLADAGRRWRSGALEQRLVYPRESNERSKLLGARPNVTLQDERRARRP